MSFSAKLSVIKNLYDKLDVTFRESLRDNSLFRLLDIEKAAMLVPFMESALEEEYYDHIHHVFKFGGHTLGVTLEDVLYLTGLPIQGKPVIYPDTLDADAFERVFGAEYKNVTRLKFPQLSAIAVNAANTKKRKIAVLLIICGAFIAPSPHKDGVTSACVHLIEDVDQVDTYAWGAALLSYVYHGISLAKAVDAPKKRRIYIDGNMWVVLGFLLIRLPSLQRLFEVNLENYPQKQRDGAPLLPWILSKMKKKTQDHRSKPITIGLLLPLLDDHIIWRPYTQMQCPRPQDLDCVRDIGPLFGYNFVTHHMPHLCDKQFKEFENYDVKSVTWNYYEIPFKQRRGSRPQKFSIIYKQQLQEWGARQPAEAYMTAREQQRDQREEEEKGSETEFYDANEYWTC